MDSMEEAVLVMMIRDFVMLTQCTWLQLITRELCCRFKENMNIGCSWLADILKRIMRDTFENNPMTVDLQR